nr:MAG TPA: hypothetical protein [Caudoviricetes sp.]
MSSIKPQIGAFSGIIIFVSTHNQPLRRFFVGDINITNMI